MTICIDGFDGRIEVYRLDKPVAHDDLINTHVLRLERESLGMENVELAINAADAYYLASCMVSLLADVKHGHLYNPCIELGIDDPVSRLIKKLELV